MPNHEAKDNPIKAVASANYVNGKKDSQMVNKMSLNGCDFLTNKMNYS
jgi:hypothetical protein